MLLAPIAGKNRFWCGMDQDKPLQKLVPAVERAVGILDLISTSKRFLTVSELSRETNLPKSTVHGLCLTMVELGLLIRRADQSYILGPHLLRWSNGFDRQTDVATEFALICEDVPIPEHATASLSVPEETDMVFIAARQSTNRNRFTARPGMRLPAVFAASGKAVLSLSADFDVRRSFEGKFPPPLTSKSILFTQSVEFRPHKLRSVIGHRLEGRQTRARAIRRCRISRDCWSFVIVVAVAVAKDIM